MKKIILAILVSFLMSTNSNSYAAWHNDARDLFQEGMANVYVLNLRTFSASDSNENGIIELESGEKAGNFVTATKRLDSLVSMGINTIHLLPITPVGKIKSLGTAGSLYAMDDFASINPQLDEPNNDLSAYEEAKLFVEEAHKRGIRVIVDLPSCGSYDMFLRRGELFEQGVDGHGVVPADWSDVRLFKVKEKDGSLNQELVDAHKLFIDMVKKIGADGIRADVATIKPYEFWQILISYARQNDPQFLFLAEASPAWMEKIENVDTFTPYDKLLSAGFDTYLADMGNYREFTSTEDLFKAYNKAKELSEINRSKKSIILNFATHDDISPVLINSNYPTQLIWLSATLPGNMYFVNGFLTGDVYSYPYAGKKAEVSYTDDETYYVHNGKLDIFNYSRRPGGRMLNLTREFFAASALKYRALAIINEITPNILKTTNKDIFAYEYDAQGSKLVVLLNHNPEMEVSSKVKYKGIDSFEDLIPIKMPTGVISFQKGKFDLRFAPSDIAVFWAQPKRAGKNK